MTLHKLVDSKIFVTLNNTPLWESLRTKITVLLFVLLNKLVIFVVDTIVGEFPVKAGVNPPVGVNTKPSIFSFLFSHL